MTHCSILSCYVTLSQRFLFFLFEILSRIKQKILYFYLNFIKDKTNDLVFLFEVLQATLYYTIEMFRTAAVCHRLGEQRHVRYRVSFAQGHTLCFDWDLNLCSTFNKTLQKTQHIYTVIYSDVFYKIKKKQQQSLLKTESVPLASKHKNLHIHKHKSA